MRGRYVLVFLSLIAVVASASVAATLSEEVAAPAQGTQCSGTLSMTPDDAIRKAVDDGATFTVENGVIHLSTGESYTPVRPAGDDAGVFNPATGIVFCPTSYCLYVDRRCFLTHGNKCPNCHYGDCIDTPCSGPFEPCP